MKLCPKCSAKNRNAAGFCEQCGENLGDAPILQEDISSTVGDLLSKAGGALNGGVKMAKQVATTEARKAQMRHLAEAAQRAEAAKKSSQFVDSAEVARASIGTNYMQNILNGGKIKRGAATLTDKRLYYFGKSVSGKGLNVKFSTEEAVIPLDEITSTRFIHKNSLGQLILGVFFLLIGFFLFMGMSDMVVNTGGVCLAIGIIFFVLFFVNRGTVFEIAFPGGKYYFDAKWYPLSDMQHFQRQLHLAKDDLMNN